MKRLAKTLPLALTCLCACVFPADDPEETGDDPSTSSASETGETPEPMEFEHCEPADVAAISGSADGSWGDVMGVASTTIDALANEAGGYVVTTLTPGTARGSSDVYNASGDEVGGTVEGEYEAEVTFGFVAAAGATYTLEGVQAASAPDYPTSWSLTWEVTPIPDCWEPNDTPDEASPIALDQTITGYMTAGTTPTGEYADADFFDYYAITIDGPGTLEIDMEQVPGDGLLRVNVLDAAGEPIGAPDPIDEMGQPFTGEVPIPAAGTYIVQVFPFISTTVRMPDGESIPSSWTTPYRFRLSATTSAGE